MAFTGDFEPVLAKHSKNFRLQDSLSVGVDNMQRNFAPMVKSVELWQQSQLTDVSARLIIYRAFIEVELEAPRHLDRVAVNVSSLLDLSRTVIPQPIDTAGTNKLDSYDARSAIPSHCH